MVYIEISNICCYNYCIIVQGQDTLYNVLGEDDSFLLLILKPWSFHF